MEIEPQETFNVLNTTTLASSLCNYFAICHHIYKHNSHHSLPPSPYICTFSKFYYLSSPRISLRGSFRHFIIIMVQEEVFFSLVLYVMHLVIV